MTLVADTRFLLVHTFPSDEEERSSIRELMHQSLRDRLVIPSVVITEYFKTAGRKIGKKAVSTQIFILKENGAEIAAFNESTALLAGELALKNRRHSIGDTLVAATALEIRASHVISDDTDFQEFGLKTKWI
jgi:predicted nucleic acid-binding protein